MYLRSLAFATPFQPVNHFQYTPSVLTGTNLLPACQACHYLAYCARSRAHTMKHTEAATARCLPQQHIARTQVPDDRAVVTIANLRRRISGIASVTVPDTLEGAICIGKMTSFYSQQRGLAAAEDGKHHGRDTRRRVKLGIRKCVTDTQITIARPMEGIHL